MRAGETRQNQDGRPLVGRFRKRERGRGVQGRGQLVPGHRAIPLLAIGYGVLLTALLYSLNQLLASEREGPWLEIASGTVLGLSLLTAALLATTAWHRRREGLRRAWAWAFGAGAATLMGVLAIAVLVMIGQVTHLLGGADVHVTRPVLRALPHPPDATLVSEYAGPAQTESITDEFQTPRLEQVGPFYREALPRMTWTEDRRPTAPLIVFRKGDFTVTILAHSSGLSDPSGPGRFTVTVDRMKYETPASTPGASPLSSLARVSAP